MGIRFYCPNGHRLNVKDFLAGKRGICPHCEARFRIPPESEIPKGSPRIKPGSPAEIAPSGNGRRRGNSSIVQTATMEKSSILVQVESDDLSDPHDPIDEAPDAVWYVRPPSGGQYGPARGEVFRRWIIEGRVSADSLVWREGWGDWKLAGPIFPSLAGLNAPIHQPESDQDSGIGSVVMQPKLEPAQLPTLPTVAKKSRGVKPAVAVVALVTLILTLGIGLVIVLALKS